MDLIKEALKKARAASDPLAEEHHNRPLGPRAGVGAPPPLAGTRPPAASPRPRWSLKRIDPDQAILRQNRIVGYSADDPSQVAFNLLRTKVFRTLRDQGLRSIAVTSPTAGCGKTVVSANLAISLSRQIDCLTVLLDLDLKRSGVAPALGVSTDGSLGDYLSGGADFRDCFVQVGDGLVVGCNHTTKRNSGDLLTDEKVTELLSAAYRVFSPKVIVIDLPPMLLSDDALSVIPHVDATLLVAAVGQSTAPQIEDCTRQLNGRNLLGVILNKSSEAAKGYHYGYG